jgi:ribosomal protein L37AE/L43A
MSASDACPNCPPKIGVVDSEPVRWLCSHCGASGYITRNDEVTRIRNAVRAYLERPGCNPRQRALAIRKLRFVAGIEED